MASDRHQLHNRGIYRNLPTFGPTLKNLSAIITGANGISGFHTMRVLLESPERWAKVYALSRKPAPSEMMALLTEDQRSRVQHVAVDFLKTSDDIAKAMRDGGVHADYVFFYSYLQPKPDPNKPKSHSWSNADELVEVNRNLLKNFIEALQKTGIKPKRFMLQTGAKNYGVHIGRHRTPACESDPQPSHLEPNFYYPQEKMLFEYVESIGSAWNIIMPAWIIGAVTTAQINGFHPWAVYASVQAQKGEPLTFPADWRTWQDERTHATARLTGYLTEWAVLEEKCKNQRFNAQDTAPLSWDRFFNELARWYGITSVVPPPDNDTGYQTMQCGKGGKEGPLGYGPPVKHDFRFSLVEWAKQPENAQAWKELQQKSSGKLTSNPFEDPQENFQMGDAVLIPIATLNMNKARRLGWTGYVDTVESIFEMYHENAKLGLVPDVVVSAASPLV